MLVETAIRLVEEISFRPGWTFTATEYKRFESAICLTVSYPAPETGRDNWAKGYPEEIRVTPSFPIQIHDCADACAFYRKVMAIIGQIDEHEAREIFRIQPTGWAPFHPHQTDGMDRWGNPHEDLRFGLV